MNSTVHVGTLGLEIKKSFKVGIICQVNVGLSFAKGTAECTLATTKSQENGFDILLLCLKTPIACVDSCQFAFTIKVGDIVFCSSVFQKISSCSMVSKLSIDQRQLKLQDLNDVINRVRSQSSSKTKIFFDIMLTIRCGPLSPLQRLLCDIAAPELSDFTFNVENENFSAHKCIISARSPVLARMLSNENYSETQQSLITINDCSKSTFMLFLRFMYGANVPYIALDATMELLKIAEKYQTTDLKKMCDDMLVANLTEADPVHDVYQFASQYLCSKELITKAYSLVQKKYLSGVKVPDKLCEYPNEVQRLVEKMEEFNNILKTVNTSLSDQYEQNKTKNTN